MTQAGFGMVRRNPKTNLGHRPCSFKGQNLGEAALRRMLPKQQGLQRNHA